MEEVIKKVVLQMIEDGELRIELYHESGFYYPDTNELRLVAEVGEESEYDAIDIKDILRSV